MQVCRVPYSLPLIHCGPRPTKKFLLTLYVMKFLLRVSTLTVLNLCLYKTMHRVCEKTKVEGQKYADNVIFHIPVWNMDMRTQGRKHMEAAHTRI
jgi:hypothetical protein